MNDAGCLITCRHQSKALPAIGLLLITTMLGCFSAAPTPIAIPTQERFSELKKKITELRGLTPKRDFGINLLPGVNSQPAPSTGDTSSTDQPLTSLAQAYKQLGLLSAGDDLTAALRIYNRLDRLMAYDGASDRLLIAAEAASLSARLTAPSERAAIELPISMAIVQALQEQHFEWQEKISRTAIDDVRLAYRAVAGGDALVTALAQGSGGKLAALNDLTATRQIASAMENLARDLPLFLRNQLVLPYREGSDFVAWAIKAQGRAGLNALYANPPYSTAQILHPERYYLTPQAPQRFSPSGLFRHIAKPTLIEQSLGEYLLRGLLETQLPPAASSQIAAGWRGDQLFSFADDGFQTSAWYTAWGSAAEAAAFQRAFQTVAEKRQRIRLRQSPRQTDATLIANTRERGSFALGRRDNIVLYLVTSSSRLSETIEAAWQDLQVEGEPAVLRFDFARGGGQLSLRNR